MKTRTSSSSKGTQQKGARRSKFHDEVQKIIGMEDINYAEEKNDVLSRWADRKDVKYTKVSVEESDAPDLNPKVETAFATTVETATEVQTNVMLEIDTNYTLLSQYQGLESFRPTIQEKPSSPILSVPQVLNRIARTKIDEAPSEYKEVTTRNYWSSETIYDYTGHFSDAKKLVMPDPNDHLSSHDNNTSHNASIYLDEDDIDAVQQNQEELNKILSFNRALYVRCGSVQETPQKAEYTEGKYCNGTTYACVTHKALQAQEKNVLFISNSSSISRFEAPITPVLTESALKILRNNPAIYNSGLDISILPLGFFITKVKIQHNEYKHEANKREQRVDYTLKEYQKIHYVLDWSNEEYKNQKRTFNRISDSNNKTRQLFIVDPFEFQNDGRESGESVTLRYALNNDEFDIPSAGNLNTFLTYSAIINEHNEELYNIIKQSLIRYNVDLKLFTSDESLSYLKELASIAILSSLETDIENKELDERIKLASYKIQFVKAVFNSMHQSNFLEVMRALTAFFIKFDEMTNFEDSQTKIRFYRLLLESTVHRNHLCIKGLEGNAQIELFRLVRILDKAAVQGPQLLELQLTLFKEKDPKMDTQSKLSLGLYGDACAYDLIVRDSYGTRQYNTMELALLDPLMHRSKTTSPTKLTDPVILSHPSDSNIDILSFISQKLASGLTLFGTSNLEHKIAIYNHIKSIVLRIEFLISKGADFRIRKVFSGLCKLYIEESLSIEHSPFNDLITWLEALERKGRYLGININSIGNSGAIAESEQFYAVFYNKYAHFPFSPELIKNLIPSFYSINESSVINFNIVNDAKIENSNHFLTRISVSSHYSYDAQCLLVHDKTSTNNALVSVDNDILRYKKLWNINKLHREHIRNAEDYINNPQTLEPLFKAMHSKLMQLARRDNDTVRDTERVKRFRQEQDKLRHGDIKINDQVCNDFKVYGDAVIDTRFLSIHALCSNTPTSLEPEKDFAKHIDWINAWVDNCDVGINKSELELVDYNLFYNKITNTTSYGELVDAMTELFPNIKSTVGAEFSLDNILKGPKPIKRGSLNGLFNGNDIVYEPKDFFKRLPNFITSNGLDAQKDDIFYNAIYKLFEYKIYRTQLSRFKKGQMTTVEFKDPEKLEKYTQILCDNYLEDFKDGSRLIVNGIFKRVEQYMEFALPILDDFEGSDAMLKFYKPFRYVYGSHITEFLGKIQSYSDILQQDKIQKFTDKKRETSAANFYYAIIQYSYLWKPSKKEPNAHIYLTRFHRYIDTVLEFGVFAQTLNDHNFTAIMETAIGLIGNDELGTSYEKFSTSSQNSAASIFDRLTQIVIRRSDPLVFEFFAYLTQQDKHNLFNKLATQLIHASDELEDLIYNLDAQMYGQRFQAFESILSGENDHNLSDKIALINCILTNKYGANKEAIITNTEDLQQLLLKLDMLKPQDFQILKRYLVPPASDLYGKAELQELFDKRSFKYEVCEERLTHVLKSNSYDFDETEIRNKFTKIQGLDDVEGLVDKYKTLFTELNKIVHETDSNLMESLKTLDPSNPNNKLVVAAYIIDSMHRITGKKMRPIQIAAFLLSIEESNDEAKRNLFNQIQTGQGKTFIISMVAAFYAMQGYRVEISTNTYELASRDAKELSALYKFLGINSAVNAITTKGTQFEDFEKASINYGTLGEIALFKNLMIQSGKAMPKAPTILIADEFDADRDNQTLYRLSRTPEFQGIKNVSVCLRIMLEQMVDFVDNAKLDTENSNVFLPGHKSEEGQLQDRNNFKEFIARKAVETNEKMEQTISAKDTVSTYRYSKELEYLEQIYDMIDQIKPKMMATLLNSCSASSIAFKEWETGRHYNEVTRYKLLRSGVSDDSVALINGILPIVNGKFNMNSWNSKFSDALQQFLAIRKNNAKAEDSSVYYDVEPLTNTSAVDAPSNLLFGRESGKYKRVIGFSGTVGNEKEKARMESTLQMTSIRYPAHEEMPKVGLFEKEDYPFLVETSRTRYDKYVLLARSEEEKIDYLISVIEQTVKNGRSDPLLILCNNHDDVYKYQSILAKRLENNARLSSIITGIQTCGLVSMKLFDEETNQMSSQDETNYLALRQKLGIEGQGDRRQTLNERIIDQAALPGVITFGTIGNDARGTDVKKHIESKRELSTIVFGCQKELLTPSALIQGLGRTFGRFDGRAGVIITIDELLNELKAFDVIIEPAKVIVSHFYKLMNLIASNNTKVREKNRVFNVILEVIQESIHKSIKSSDDASEASNKLMEIYQDVYEVWSTAQHENKDYDAFSQNVLKLLEKSVQPEIHQNIADALWAEKAHYDFTEVEIEKEDIKQPKDIPAGQKGFTGLTGTMFDTPLFKLFALIAPIALEKALYNSELYTSTAPSILVPIVSGVLHSALFQAQVRSSNDKIEKLRIWNYESEILYASIALGAKSGTLFSIQQQLFYQMIQMSGSILAEHQYTELANLALGNSYIISAGISAAITVMAYSYLRDKAIESIDSSAEYNLKPEIEDYIKI